MNIKYVLDSMEKLLDVIDAPAQQHTGPIHSSQEQAAHLKSMIITMKEMPMWDDEDVEKLMRWIGFMQGSLWALGFFSIDDFREMNTHE